MTPKQLLTYEKIIESKKWNENPLHTSVRNKMLRLLRKLNIEEIDIVLELLQNFTWISSNQYDKKILDIFRQIDPDIISTAKKFYFFPIVKPNDSGKLKSGLSLIYPLLGIINYIEEFDKIDIKSENVITRYKNLNKLLLEENEYLILVDDFIGSGKTFESCIEAIEKSNVSTDRIILVSIAIQNDGLKLIEKKKIRAYYSHIEKKGITDYFYDEEQTKRISLMRLIERRLKFKPKFSLGFEESQALIALIRTPNNTFPIFWHEYSENDNLVKAPFQRR
ncbi:phosphoribosyltransferase [Reichenbachiella ulvae]|uniref:Phosphoribosyltransferase n=1 Tax=Reichenbachiella ulvae TaxID=2980104 RepID=A0ABT3CTZ8_9BACT|nr:phosphoribosyltransferase [Reichenbachiella ulvae]MCV9386994.1 phosphoribosyltransferase [Reichenbachiella ulvae]